MLSIDPALIARARTWLFDDALPFWASNGFDHITGAPRESLTLDGTADAKEGFQRVRALTRQVYVFAHGDYLGWGQGKAHSDQALNWLISKAHAGDGSWHKLLFPDGSVKDATPDLYDHAFVLFALGWRVLAYQDQDALALAHLTLDRIERDFSHPTGLGFHHTLPPSLPRQQNPHMHLTEASLIFAQAGDARFGALADRLVDLFKHRIVEAETGILQEYFDEGWRPVNGDLGRIIEPGHQFEWAWILARHQLLRRGDNAAVIQALVRHAERHGVDQATGATYNQMWTDGTIKDGGSRTWPNTERVKGWIGLGMVASNVDARSAEQALSLLFDRYLDPAPAGCWIDAFDEAGTPIAKTVPASTFYHVLLAFAEVLACEG
jgi:mannose/cellobiose epimerase-like protein (N-acyl-D-glucosamine 2-epimerase family)